MKKKPERGMKVSLLAAGLLTMFLVLDLVLAIAGGRSRRYVRRSLIYAAVCVALFFYLLYQRWKNRGQ